MTDVDDAKVVPLDRARSELPTRGPNAAPPPPDKPRLDSGEAPPRQREETLAERLDHALDDIRRLMVTDRTKGPF